jgi:hypothetical protein
MGLAGTSNVIRRIRRCAEARPVVSPHGGPTPDMTTVAPRQGVSIRVTDRPAVPLSKKLSKDRVVQ